MTENCERCGYDLTGLDVCPECGAGAGEQERLLEARRGRAVLTLAASFVSLCVYVPFLTHLHGHRLLSVPGSYAVGAVPFVWIVLIVARARWPVLAQRLILAGSCATLGLMAILWVGWLCAHECGAGRLLAGGGATR